MKTLAAALVLAPILLAAPGAAHAFTSAPGHADIRVKPIHKTVGGQKKVVGAEVNFAVRKAGGSWDAATHARPSVFLPEIARAMKDSSEASRHAVYEPTKFKGVQLFDDIHVPQPNVVVPGKIKIMYDAAKGVQSGGRLTLITAWKYNPTSSPHVYGTVTSYDEGNEFDLP